MNIIDAMISLANFSLHFIILAFLRCYVHILPLASINSGISSITWKGREWEGGLTYSLANIASRSLINADSYNSCIISTEKSITWRGLEVCSSEPSLKIRNQSNRILWNPNKKTIPDSALVTSNKWGRGK